MKFAERIKANLWLEWALLKRPFVFGTVMFTGLMQWTHNITHNWVHFLAGKNGVFGGPKNALTDLGFIGMEKIFSYDMEHVSDPMLFCIIALAICACGSVVFTNYIIQNPEVRMLQILVRSCWVSCIAVFLRIVSFLVTLLPSPAPHCAQENFKAPQTASEILFHFDVGSGCSDLIFSSHMMYGLVAAGALHYYLVVGNKGFSPKSMLQAVVQRGLIVLVWTMAFLEAIAIVRQKRHYSIDIWTACYAVPMIWMSVAYLFPNDVKYETDSEQEVPAPCLSDECKITV